MRWADRLVGGLSALALKVMETQKVMEAPLPGPVCAAVQRPDPGEIPLAARQYKPAGDCSPNRGRD